ncbi:MAG TPA: CHAT domain-containing protein [Thermoanaerobaculia bacterium]|nr:CHAT domain-containing protein [Thermoanaerobaculia bacterium]
MPGRRPLTGWTPTAGHARLFVFLVTLAGVSCHAQDGWRDVAELDGKILAVVDRVLDPVPRFSGSSFNAERFRPQSGGPCPPALGRAKARALDHDERRRLPLLRYELTRLAAARGNVPAVLRVRAIWTLLSNPTPEGRDRMVRLLQVALAREPGSASRRNDLAAAHLLRASLDGQSSGFAMALELLSGGPPLPRPAGLVNQAYASQCLTLWNRAQESWRQLDLPQPADRRPRPGPRAALSSSASGGATMADPLEWRRRGEWLLGEWGEQLRRGNVTASETLLREAEAIGAKLQARGGDPLLGASIRVIRWATSRGNRAAVKTLASGHAAFHEVRGDAIYSDCRLETLRYAARELAAASSPFVRWVRLDQAVCAYYANHFSRAEAILTALQYEAQQRGEIALEGRAEWMLGLLRVVQARFAEANRHYARAIELFSRLGEEAHVVYLRSLRARSYEYGGARRDAWRERLAALTGRAAIRDPIRLFVVFDEAVQALQAQGYRSAALAFLSEQMRAAEAGARQSGKTDLLVFTLLARAVLLAETGRRTEAARDVAGAEEAWSRLTSFNENRNRQRIEIDLQRALLDGRGVPEPLAAVDRAIGFFASSASSLGGQLQALKLYQLRAQIDSRRGDFQAARADLLRGAAEIERQRLEVARMEDRAHFLAQARDLFLDLVRLELDRFHDPLAALDALERSSNRVLADAAPRGSAKASTRVALRLGTLRESVADGMLVVRFGHLPDRLLLWTYLDGRLELEQRPLPEAELGHRIERCRDFLARGQPGDEREAACDTIAQTLLPRRLRKLAREGGVGTVVLVPDEIVAPLPLGSLRIAPGGPYLLERLQLCYVPSLALLLAGEPGPDRRSSPPRSALFVSDPAFDRDLFPSLQRLPAARRTVSIYASHYARSEILSDRQATAKAVLSVIDRFDVLHFDGHALTNSQYPERGGLLLAPSNPRRPERASSLLTAADLPPRALRRLRLVILGACSTGLATYQDTAETAGLAAAFLAEGVPEVVAAAWEVPDDDVAELLGRFHQELAAGRSAAAALQSAQIMFLRSPARATAAWAAFQLFVGAKSGVSSVSRDRG